jgi:hypothetical protein
LNINGEPQSYAWTAIVELVAVAVDEVVAVGRVAADTAVAAIAAVGRYVAAETQSNQSDVGQPYCLFG